MSPPRPPRLAAAVLARLLPAGERAELIGDLDEEFAARASTSAPRRALARLWYCHQAAALAWSSRRIARAGLGGHDGAAPGLLADSASDWRQAWRSLVRGRSFTAVALLSISGSLGLATAVFTAAHILLHPLDVPASDRVVRLGGVTPISSAAAPRLDRVGGTPPPPGLADTLVGAWFARRNVVTSLASYAAYPQTVEIEGEPLRVNVAQVGAEYFEVLPVQPTAGRTLQRADGVADATPAAVLSQRLFTQRRAHPAELVGRVIRIDERPYQVAGILPLEYEWPDPTVDVWVVDPVRWPEPGEMRQMGRFALMIGRLRDDAGIEDARAEGQRIADDLAALSALTGDEFATPRIVVLPLEDELAAPVRPALLLLVTATIAVVLAANINLAGLLMSRNIARRREMAVRQALGASRWRLFRPLLFEQLLLGGAGGFGAFLLAWWLVDGLPSVAPAGLPGLSRLQVDGWSLASVWVVSLGTAVVVGLLPARSLPASSLRTAVAGGVAAAGGVERSAERRRAVLVTLQVSLATMLLVGSALIGRSLIGLLRIDLGYQPAQVLTFQIGTSERMAFLQKGRLTQIYAALEERLLAHPAVTSMGTSSALPLHGDTLRMTLHLPGLTPPRPDGAPRLMVHVENVSAAYLQTIGARLTRGRWFAPQDTATSEKVAIVNEAFVEQVMPGAEPLGMVIPHGVHRPRIVGVVDSIKRAAATQADEPAMYRVAPQTSEGVALFASRAMGVAVRTTGDPMALAGVVRQAVREIEAAAPVHNMMPLDVRVRQNLAQPRFMAIALVLFAALAVGTALVGVYGILSASVERRRLEIGVRRALGATTPQIARLVVWRALRLSTIGLVVGAGLAAAGAQLGRSLIYGISPGDAVSYVAAAVAVLSMALAGAWLPARTALRIDPVRVLRDG